MRKVNLLLLGLVLSGCANDDFGSLDGGSDVSSPWPDQFVGEAAPDGLSYGRARVFAHTEGSLYEVDPASLAISLVAAFVWPAGTDIAKMTDIALDKNGRMIGVSRTTVYSVDPKTAHCTRMASLPVTQVHFVGLSFVVGSSIDKEEFLMGLDKDGAVYRIDPQTGTSTSIGQLGGGLQAGGDVVSVTGFGTMVTVKGATDDTDWLARLDPSTGTATLIGDTGFARVWGLGFWKGKLYGFTEAGEFVLLDPSTGKAALKATAAEGWWGAGVTTVAPVVD